MDRSESPVPPSDRRRNQPSIYNLDFLLNQSRWIRDDLDTQIARDGPHALHADDILNLDSFLRRLLTSSISLDDIRFSRLHLALKSISGQATRWPKRLISRADEVKANWENLYGSLDNITTPLYEQGGRLFGLCKPEDLNKDMLMIKWLKTPGVKLNPFVARRRGDLGFKPGEYVSLVSSVRGQC